MILHDYLSSRLATRSLSNVSNEERGEPDGVGYAIMVMDGRGIILGSPSFPRSGNFNLTSTPHILIRILILACEYNLVDILIQSHRDSI